MPLLRKKPFRKVPLPKDYKESEEVFHCELTGEVFRDYETYCRRILLCNGMIWTCTMTGKSNLTYAEALESERNARCTLKDFPKELRIPILFLASKTLRTSFAEMAEDVFVYVKDRYFVKETVDSLFIGNKWKESHVLQVIAPTEKEIKNVRKNGQTSERHFYPPASLYRYEVEQVDSEDQDISEVMIVDYEHIRRKKSCYSRDKNKLFLKQYVEQNECGIMVVKQSVMERYNIRNIKFEQIFDGPMPDFEVSKKIKNGKKARQETLSNFLKKNHDENKNNGISESLLDKMKQRQKEFQEMKQKKADERLVEKQKQKEENIQISIIVKDWYKPKEDLELEDHKILPVPAPLQLKVPDKYTGDALEILEFVHSFSKLLWATDFFPNGFTLEILERALLQKEVAGPLLDIIQMFLSALFHFQSQESEQYNINPDNSIDIRGLDPNDNISLTEAANFATLASTWSTSYQGVLLSQLPMYSLTTSEILRLHLLSSGARINETGARWRYQLRGGYTSEDDPGLYFRLKYPHVLKSLALHNVIELPIGDKLKILHCLMNQLLTYADLRDVIEDRIEKTKHAKIELKSMQMLDRKREQEYITAKCKLKKDARENNKDATAELESLLKTTEKQKTENDIKIEELMKVTVENQTWLGCDRALRKYYKLESVPGFFVNFEVDNPGVCLDKCVDQNPELVGAGRSETLAHVRKIYKQLQVEENGTDGTDTGSVHKENDVTEKPKKVNGVHGSLEPACDADTLLTCSADPTTCIVHSNKSKQRWSFFPEQHQFIELVDSLNPRGVRESDLRQTLIADQSHLESLINQTPVTHLNPNVTVSSERYQKLKNRKPGRQKQEDVNLGYPPEMNSTTILEYSLVDHILELESKIYAGNLGRIKVKDREEWRKNLTDHNYNLLDKTGITREVNGTGKSDSSRPNSPEEIVGYKDPGKFLGSNSELKPEYSDDEGNVLPLCHTEDRKLVIKSLAIALVQLGQGVERRYLKKPLGNYSVKKKNTQVGNMLAKWEQSLLGATSYSQLFLHYCTLDNCILWSRSALLAKCQICRRPNDSENMLLCDNCNKGHHLYCLKPKLTSVPVGDWFCRDCNTQKEEEEKLNNPEPPPPQKKRRIFKEELSDEESIKSEPSRDLDEEEESMDDDEDEDFLKAEVCKKCGTEGTLLCCDNCPDMYHLECSDPPLRRVPRGEWFCYKCKLRRTKDHYSESDSASEIISTRRSNRREIETRDDLPLHNAPLQELLADVLKQECAWPFIRPVQKVEVPDYYDIITKPMDFGTIKYKLNMGEYKCDADLMADAVLVFENCTTYNNSDDEVYKCGFKLHKYFISKCQELGLKLPQELLSDEDEDDDLNPPDMKRKRTK